MTNELIGRIDQAVDLQGDDAAIRIHADYGPQAGASAKVFPPTYLPSAGTRYHYEERWGAEGAPVKVVLLDSFQSQANRAEAALREHAEDLGLPQLVMEVQVGDRVVRVSSLDAPHRSRDAYFLDSEIDGTRFDDTEVGKALLAVTAENATAALRYAPYDLIFGVWDSHRGKRIATKFARSYSSEMLGWDALPGKRSATKGDPLNLPGNSTVPLSDWRPGTETAQKKKAEQKLSELGHGMVPGQPDEEAGGVSVRSITREAIISLTGLAALRFSVEDTDVSIAGRTALAALALVADRLAFAGAGLHLRSGSDLVLTSERVEWVRRGDEAEPLDLPVSSARELLAAARDRLRDAGVPWSAEPIVVHPSPRLSQVIEQTFTVATIDAAE